LASVIVPSTSISPETISGSARAFAAAAASENTRRAYKGDWKAFTGWCERAGRTTLPAELETLADFIASMADSGYKPSTINRRVSAIARAHRLAGFPTPLAGVARETMAGVRRTLGVAPRQVAPVTVPHLRAMIAALPDGVRGARDQALLLVGFAGALRRSELVGLDVADLLDVDAGILVTLKRSKTDQEGVGRQVGIPYGSHRETCPVRSLRHWLEISNICEGAIFRPVKGGNVAAPRLSGRSVADIVQRAAKRAGLDSALFSGHSLRAGLATAAAAAGVSELDIARTTGHKSVAVLRRYVRTATGFERNAAASIGL
jgi:site-specific recombinase XerD